MSDYPRAYHVLVAPELLPSLRDWSVPVQVRIVGEAPDGELTMEFRFADPRRPAAVSPSEG
jgi:hypothetical protein